MNEAMSNEIEILPHFQGEGREEGQEMPSNIHSEGPSLQESRERSTLKKIKDRGGQASNAEQQASSNVARRLLFQNDQHADLRGSSEYKSASGLSEYVEHFNKSKRANNLVQEHL
jgi:hypothetical protein